MPPPILTLTTDFGIDDHYVGTMKGVILGICPEARIVDISHGVRPFDIAGGAYLIAQAWHYFPPGTVHIVVIDPGVGTERRPILVEAGGQYFVGPDNGVFSMVFLRETAKVRVISNEALFRHPVSRTFHGRDIFSPVGAHIAAGVSAAAVGEEVEEFVKGDFATPCRTGDGRWSGSILKIDHFGNIVTNFHVDDVGHLVRSRFSMRLKNVTIGAFAGNYAESPQGELFAIVGSSGYYEISLAQGSAAAQIGCEAGAAVELVEW